MPRAKPLVAISSFTTQPVFPTALLDDSTLRSIHEMNETFLCLVAERTIECPKEPPFGLRASLASHLGLLDAEAVKTIAACPYTLFDMAFDDIGPWRRGALAFPASPALSDAVRAFARMVAFFVWHLTRGDLLTAALALGMSPSTHRAWRALPLSAVDSGANWAAPRLAARWGYHRFFWNGLLAHSLQSPPPPAPGTHLLGLQLLAADGLRPFKQQKELPV